MAMPSLQSFAGNSKLLCGVCKIKFNSLQNFEAHKIFCKPNKKANKVIGNECFDSQSHITPQYIGPEVVVGENQTIENYSGTDWEYTEVAEEVLVPAKRNNSAEYSQIVAKKKKPNIPPSFHILETTENYKRPYRKTTAPEDFLLREQKLVELGSHPKVKHTSETSQIENEVFKWMAQCARLGFPRSLIDANGALKEKSKGYPIQFIKNPVDFEPIEIRNIALKDVSQLKKFHYLLKNFLKDMNLIHIFDDSSRIFNVDSVLFELYSEGNNTARPNSFNKLLQSNVLFTCSADGNFLAPLVTLPEGDTFTFLPKLTSEGFFISTNKYGIVTNDTLIHYIQDLFHPALLRNGVEFPVILLIDGQKLNLPWRIFEICNNLEIVLVSIYPNFSTVITPTDIAVAQKIKKVWKTFLTQTLGDVKNLTVKNFPSTLKSFSGRHFQSQNVKDGFKFTGIFPFSPNSICLKPLLSCTSKPVMIHSKKRVFVHKEDVVYLKDAYGCNE